MHIILSINRDFLTFAIEYSGEKKYIIGCVVEQSDDHSVQNSRS